MIYKIKNELIQAKTFLSFTFVKIFGHLFIFLISLIIAKMLSPAGFGSYSLSIMIVFFFTSLFIYSSQIPFIVYANEEKKRDNRINITFSIQLVFLLMSLISFILILFLFKNNIKNFTGMSDLNLVFLFFAYLGIGLNSFIENLFLALDKRFVHALYFLAFGTLNLVLILFFYSQKNVNINTIFLTFFISGIISFVLFFHQIEFKKLFPFVLEKRIFFEMSKWVKWQIMGSISIYLINWGDNIVLSYFVSMEEIGVYNLGYQLFKGLISLTYILYSYFIPFISQNFNDNKKMRNYLYVKRPKIILIGILCGVFIFVSIPHIISYIYGNIYKESAVVLRILLVGLFFHLYVVFYTPIFNSMKRYKFIQSASIIQILINILLDIILVPIMGIIGAAIGTTMAYFVTLILYERYFLDNFPKLLKGKI